MTHQRTTRSWTRGIVALVSSLGALGCLGNEHGHPDRRGVRSVASPAYNKAQAHAWRRVVFGSLPDVSLGGYLRLEQIRSAPSAITTWVYDPNFKLVGRISPLGETVRFSGGSARMEGHYSVEHGLLVLLAQSKTLELDLQPMPPPRES